MSINRKKIINGEIAKAVTAEIQADMSNMTVVSLSSVRQMTAKTLASLPGPIVVKDGCTSLAVIVPYFDFLKMAKDLRELEAVLSGLQSRMSKSMKADLFEIQQKVADVQ